MRKRILVMGSFQSSKSDNRVGGLGFASQSLVSGDLALEFDFVKIDSTVQSLQSHSVLSRAPWAVVRVILCFWYLAFGGISASLCFASHGTSFLEKGMVVLGGRLIGKRMILMPRSGHLVEQINRSKLFRGFVKLVLRKASVVVCQSEGWKLYFLQLLGKAVDERFIVIENWLPNNAFVASDSPVAKSDDYDKKFVVGYLNRIEKNKGIYDFIEAVRRAHKIDPRFFGRIYGDGAELAAIRRYINNQDLRTFIAVEGWVDGALKNKALRNMDVYMFVSHTEGFPNSLLEVVAQKVPVISVTVGSVPDVLRHGVSAYLTSIGDVDALSNYLVLMLRERVNSERMAEAAYRRVAIVNSMPNAINKFLKVLR